MYYTICLAVASPQDKPIVIHGQNNLYQTVKCILNIYVLLS